MMLFSSYSLTEVTLQISTAVGLAVTSSIATTITENQSHGAELSPDALLAGYRVAGWICFATAVIGIPLNFYSLRGLGVIGSGVPGVDTTKDTTKADDLPGASSAEIGATKERSEEV
jgi:hypothetical protein